MPHLNDARALSANTVLRCEAGERAMATTVPGPVERHDTGRLQRLLPGATSASRFGGAFEDGARAAGAVACFVRLSKSTTTAPRFHRPPGRRPAGLLSAMVAQDARLRRVPARRAPGLRWKVPQRNGAVEPGASASNFIRSIIGRTSRPAARVSQLRAFHPSRTATSTWGTRSRSC